MFYFCVILKVGLLSLVLGLGVGDRMVVDSYLVLEVGSVVGI